VSLFNIFGLLSVDYINNFKHGCPGLRSAVIWLASGVLAGAVTALLMAFLVLYYVVQPSMALNESSSISSLRLQDREIVEAFNNIEAIDEEICSQDHLSSMRSVVLRSRTIRDAAYTDGVTVLCSSGHGQINTSFESFGPPDFRAPDGRQIWRNVELPTAPGVRSSIVVKGNFSLMVAPGGHRPVDNNGNPLSTVLINPLSGAVTTIKGPPVNLGASALIVGGSLRQGLSFIASECIGGFLCQVQVVGPREIWREYNIPIVLIVLVGAGLGVASALFALLIKRRREAFESRLRRALLAQELSLEYQPIINLNTGGISGAEGLMRWTLQSRDRISPAEFIAAAEKSSLITDLTCFAVETISRELRSVLIGDLNFVVSINIVSRDLTDPRFFLSLYKNIEAVGISPNRIALELTERQPINSPEASSAIKSLHEKGYRIYIDDFGTGYSNLSYLGELSVDAIKLDMIYTQSIGSDSVRSKLIPVILGMVLNSDISLIAEGVETAEQEEYLKEMGVNLVQGWRYGRGMSSGSLLELVAP
jgi:sensor c-di-GMP phosphodiesterase-like protein